MKKTNFNKKAVVITAVQQFRVENINEDPELLEKVIQKFYANASFYGNVKKAVKRLEQLLSIEKKRTR